MSTTFKKLSLIIAFLVSSNFFTSTSFAWDGFDQDENSVIEIGPGNLVKEGLIIDFYDDSDLHTGKVISVNSVGGGTELIVEDVNNDNKERIFIMRD